MGLVVQPDFVCKIELFNGNTDIHWIFGTGICVVEDRCDCRQAQTLYITVIGCINCIPVSMSQYEVFR